MQFKLSKTHRYWWPVTVRLPDPDHAGQIIEQDLRLWLEPLTRDEALAAQDRIVAAASTREAVACEIEDTLRVVRGWEGVVDDDNEPVPFSEGALRQALQHSWFRNSVAEAIAASQRGEAARLGN